ncbi:MAG: Bifunctional ligase/repressor BirA [Gammaproteobacteria bacterium]|nr:Bifunctional ligase/repressor BirA [Gammaproteobacteria bacterium]
MRFVSTTGEDRRWRLLSLIADGAVHSGAAIARHLRLSRTAVWQQVHALQALGLVIDAERGSGYRLAGGIDLFDVSGIHSMLSAEARRTLRGLRLYFETDSTNQRLLDLARAEDVHAQVCLAEIQTAGRGRRGRRWLGSAGGDVALSLAWRFNAALEALAGLSLAAGIAVHRALSRLGVDDGLMLKWPNDVVFRQQKLAGILVEIQGEMGGPCLAVIGIGLNVDLPAAVRAEVQQPVTDLKSALGTVPTRNAIVAQLLGELVGVLREFEARGFGAFAEEWARLDAAYGREVDVHLPSGVAHGVAMGVTEDGALRLNVAGADRRLHSGEVSLRFPP